jgi:putative transposase
MVAVSLRGATPMLWRQPSRLQEGDIARSDNIPLQRCVIKARLRRLDWIYLDAPVYFITCCTRDRRHFPSLQKVRDAIQAYGERGRDEFGIALGRYVVMPDHVHLFVSGLHNVQLSRWIAGLKRAIAIANETRGAFWQPTFFDHVLRSGESYAQKWTYVCENPVRAGLVKTIGEWPYQGEVVALTWT